MSAYLVDTDVLIDVLRGHRRLRWPPGSDAAMSVLTRAELFAGRSVDEEALRRFLAPYDEIHLDHAIAERAGRIRREGGLGIADAVIAASASQTGRILVTRNRRDFDPVEGLTVVDPDDLPRG